MVNGLCIFGDGELETSRVSKFHRIVKEIVKLGKRGLKERVTGDGFLIGLVVDD